MSRVSDAAAAERFHAARLGEPVLRWLTVAGGWYRIEDDCARCGEHGPITTDWLCGACVTGKHADGGPMR